MTIDTDRLFAQPAFRQLDPAQVALLRRFAQDINGKSTPEMLRQFWQLNREMARIKPISDAQWNEIAVAVRNFLPDAERKKMDALLKMRG